jgi:hypothetical protein
MGFLDFDIVTPLQLIVTLICIIALVFGVLCMIKYPKYKLLIFVPLTYLIHLIIFYIFILYMDIINEETGLAIIINGWSTGTKLHMVFLILSGLVLVYFKGNKLWLQKS